MQVIILWFSIALRYAVTTYNATLVLECIGYNIFTHGSIIANLDQSGYTYHIFMVVLIHIEICGGGYNLQYHISILECIGYMQCIYSCEYNCQSISNSSHILYNKVITVNCAASSV